MQSVLDIIINPKGAIEGARQVNQSLNRIKREANETTNTMNTKFSQVKQTLFSLQSAFLAIGVGAFAKSMIDVTRNLNKAEHAMMAVASSSAQAHLQLERVRTIADEFMMEDLPMANAFRLLASHDIPNAERALRTLGNVALTINEDIEQVTLAMLSGNERQLRRLGVRLVDLGTGQVDLVFGNMEIRANKTDAAIRRGLLQLFEKGFPDATKHMANDMDFQIKRLHDGWEDFRIAIMRGGLEDFLTGIFKEIADGFNEEEMKEKGRAIAQAIQETIKTIAKDIAFVMDLLAPLGSLASNILGTSIRFFNQLPPVVQTIGIFGALFFGWQGFAALTAGLYLADKLGLKAEEISKGVSQLGSGFTSLAENSPLGALMKKTAEVQTGKAIGSVSDLAKSETAAVESYSSRVEKMFNRVTESSKKLQEQRKRADEQAKADRAAGGTGLRGGRGISDEERILNAQLEKLKGDTAVFIQQESDKRNRLFDPDRAQELAKSVEFINSLREKGLPIEERHVRLITEQFIKRGEAVAQTRVWLEVENERMARLEEGNRLMSQATMELQEAVDASKVMELSIEKRELESAKLAFQRELMQGKVFLQREEKDEIIAKLELIDQERKKVQALQMMEAKRLEMMEETARLNAETRDMLGQGIAGRPIGGFPGATGQSNPSRQSLLEEQEREFINKGVAFDREKAALEIDNKLRAQRANFIARENFELQQQINQTNILVETMGMMTDERQAEIRLRETVLRLQQRGVDLTEDEIERLRQQQNALQEAIANERTAQAINSFVDNFRVGWDTIVRSGEQAYQHLEDALTQWIMTGKMDFTSFVNFVQQELIRMGIRASLSKLMGMAGGGGGGFDIFGLVQQGIGAGLGALKGPGFGAASSLGAGSGNLVPTASNFAQRGGVFDAYGRIPGFQQGGVNHHERLIKISEGQTAEAIIPLSGGRHVPVKMMDGGRAVTINAPITFVTPDANGARRSQTQIQSQMSSVMTRAARRIQ